MTRPDGSNLTMEIDNLVLHAEGVGVHAIRVIAPATVQGSASRAYDERGSAA